jgi:hypothetical protein
MQYHKTLNCQSGLIKQAVLVSVVIFLLSVYGLDLINSDYIESIYDRIKIIARLMWYELTNIIS